MRLSYKAILCSGAFALFIYLEFIAYWTLPLKWVKQPECSPPYCMKLLLVADPQIVGPEWHGFFFIDWIAIFDSDRYIKRTFENALSYIQPDIIVFLGDLMDQGFTATQSEYVTYMNRFRSIFELPENSNKIKVILSPGDNDIGGIDDILIPSSVRRFDKAFNQTDESTLADFIEFCNANLMTYRLQQSKFIDDNQNIVRIALSHVPLVPKKSHFLNEVVKKIKPHLILSGHLHKAFHYTTHANDLGKSEQNVILPQNLSTNIYHFEEGLIHEIIVPTCSYRMGVYNMGYGVAYIDIQKMTVQYNILWLPHRFFQLFIYLFIASQIILVGLVKMCRRTRQQGFQKQSHTLSSQGNLSTSITLMDSKDTIYYK